MNGETERITFAPHGALLMRRLELTVPTENPSLSADEEQRAVNGAARTSIEFHHPNDDVDARASRRCTEPIGSRAGNLHGIRQICCRCPPCEGGHRGGEEGVAGQPGFPEGGERGPLLRCLRDEAARLLGGGVAVEEDRACLDGRKGELGILRHGYPLLLPVATAAANTMGSFRITDSVDCLSATRPADFFALISLCQRGSTGIRRRDGGRNPRR